MYLKMKPISTIKARLGIQPNGPVKKFFAETCYRYMDKYVPMSNTEHAGDLRTTVDIQPDSITYEMPYARYQYKGMREDGTHKVQHYTTPGTGPYWDKRMVSADMKQVVKETQDFIKRGAK